MAPVPVPPGWRPAALSTRLARQFRESSARPESMSDSGYLKCSCSHCQGHIEFPEHALGVAAACPHCGVETILTVPEVTPVPPAPPPPKPSVAPSSAAATPAPVAVSMTPVETASAGSKVKQVLKVVWSVLVGLAVVAFVGLKVWKYFRRAEGVVQAVKVDPNPAPAKPPSASPKAAPMPAPTTVPTSVVLAKGVPPSRKAGEDLQVLSFEVHKAKDGNLQYIVGVVTNHAAQQYFNVKLTFELTRQGGKPGDTATDTLRNLPASGSANFKASVIGTTPVTAAMLTKLEGEKE